ncbi:MAG: ABC transporter permease [Candidatus Eiseniibacteriota bacterium]
MNIPLKYNVRNLTARRGTILMTVVSIAFVVLVYIGVLSLAGGLGAAFGASGDPRNVLVLRDGARAETESTFPTERHREMAALPGVERGADGQPLASGEVLILQILTRRDGSESNVVLRGVEPAAFGVRPKVRVVEGRRFEPGKGEVVVGAKLAERFPQLELGKQVTFGRIDFRVVGLIDAGGGSFASEVWGAVEDFGDAFQRQNYCSSSLLRTASEDEAKALVARIEADQRLNLAARLETEYYEEQTTSTGAQFVVLGTVLAVLMAFGACFAAANTMYAQVAARSKEIGTLRALGFPRRAILGAFLLEAAFLGLLAGVLGAVASLPLNGITTGTTNYVTFSEISFSLRTTPDVLLQGIVLAVLTGVVGGLVPAFSASRRPIAELLRS